MNGFRNQHTIASPCSVAGRGYWSGTNVRVTMHPATVGEGIVFVRSDLPGRPQANATIENADGVSFRTNLKSGEAEFELIEHVMAALAGLEIDNCLVEVDSCELPGLDGSCLPYAEALQAAGLVIQAAPRAQFVVEHSFRVEFDDAYIDFEPISGPLSKAGYFLDYGEDSPIHSQFYRGELTPRNFLRQVAPARTFVTLEQAEMLRAQGVAAHVSNQDLLVISSQGVVDNELRFRNECARHKLLDLIGDLSLCGVDLVGQVTSYRGGHRLNAMAARRIMQELKQQDAAGNSKVIAQWMGGHQQTDDERRAA